MEKLFQNKTRSICDEVSRMYFLQHDPYIPRFEFLKEVEYRKRKFYESGYESHGLNVPLIYRWIVILKLMIFLLL